MDKSYRKYSALLANILFRENLAFFAFIFRISYFEEFRINLFLKKCGIFGEYKTRKFHEMCEKILVLGKA